MTSVSEVTSTLQNLVVEPTGSLPETSVVEASTVLPTVLETLSPTKTKEEQIITLLPEEEVTDETDESQQLLSCISQNKEQEVNGKQDQHQVHGNVRRRSCSCESSLEEYLLRRCFPPLFPKRTTKTGQVESRPQTSTHFQQTHTLLPVLSSSFPGQELHTWTTVTSSSSASDVVAPSFSQRFEDVSLELVPSLTSALATVVSTDGFTSQATHSLDPSVVDLPDLKLNEKSKEKTTGAKRTPLPTCSLESNTNQESSSQNIEKDQDQNSVPPVENSSSEQNSPPSLPTSTESPVTTIFQSPSTDRTVVQPDVSETLAPSELFTSPPVTEPFEPSTVHLAEPKGDHLLEEAPFGGHVNIHSALGNGQTLHASTSDFYAEMQISTEAPIHGSNQKESVFMRLNNRIKALEVNMSLSSRYLEQLSQRYDTYYNVSESHVTLT